MEMWIWNEDENTEHGILRHLSLSSLCLLGNKLVLLLHRCPDREMKMMSSWHFPAVDVDVVVPACFPERIESVFLDLRLACQFHTCEFLVVQTFLVMMIARFVVMREEGSAVQDLTNEKVISQRKIVLRSSWQSWVCECEFIKSESNEKSSKTRIKTRNETASTECNNNIEVQTWAGKEESHDYG